MQWYVFALTTFVVLSGCTSTIDPQFTDMPVYAPDIAPEDFVEGIDHPYLPFVVGATWTYYIGSPGDFEEKIVVTVLDETKDIQGVNATVVRDTVYDEEGGIVEDTYDWYGQDTAGNVWYLGEDTCEYEDGECVTTAGSFEWGVDGALPGIVMHADPSIGTAYYQEYYPGEAMDRAKVLGRGESFTTVLGTFTDTVHTLEWTPLEPTIQEHAVYVHGIGPIIKGEMDDDGFEDAEQLFSYDVPGFGSGGV